MEKFIAIDLFCGAGGLSSGLVKSGFDIKLGVDIDKKALETYKTNFKHAKVMNADIGDIKGYDLERLASLKENKNFLLAGCPPCQGFSNIGKRDVNDEKNQLVFEYVRVIKEMKPNFILMENVPGMSKNIGKQIFEEVVKILSEDYYIEYATLNAADYGVPQIRKRLVLQGIKKNVYKKILELLKVKKIKFLPEATYNETGNNGCKKWVCVKDAIMDLPIIQAGESFEGDRLYNHVARKLSPTNIERLKNIRENGGSRRGILKKYELNCHKKENVSYTDTYGILDLNRPSPTLTSGCTTISKGRFAHPIQNRGISIREAARLQSFDDEFIFSGNLGSMSLQIGNAIPTKLAEASGREIYQYMMLYHEYLRDNCNIENYDE